VHVRFGGRASETGSGNTATALTLDPYPYIPTWAGFLYLAVVLDAFSRKIVGWAMATHLRTELVVAALDMALGQRRPAGVIHHSDHGCQYTSLAFGQRCDQAGVRPSMGSVGDCFDNDYASYCTSLIPCYTMADAGRRRDNLMPGALRGGLVPGGSYRQSFLSL
jgi:transposase InsO family protein